MSSRRADVAAAANFSPYRSRRIPRLGCHRVLKAEAAAGAVVPRDLVRHRRNQQLTLWTAEANAAKAAVDLQAGCASTVLKDFPIVEMLKARQSDTSSA